MGWDGIWRDQIKSNQIIGDKSFDCDQIGNMIEPRIWLNRGCDSMGNDWLWGTYYNGGTGGKEWETIDI